MNCKAIDITKTKISVGNNPK